MPTLRSLVAGLAFIALAASAPVTAQAQTPPPATPAAPAAPAATSTASAKDVEGTWKLVSVTVGEGAKKNDLFGANPKGQMVLADGRFTIVVTKADIPKYKSGNRGKGTADEFQATVQGSVAYFGTYAVENGELIFKVEGSTFPNWVGETQHRTLKLSGDDLTYETPVAKNSGQPTVIAWKKIK